MQSVQRLATNFSISSPPPPPPPLQIEQEYQWYRVNIEGDQPALSIFTERIKELEQRLKEQDEEIKEYLKTIQELKVKLGCR